MAISNGYLHPNHMLMKLSESEYRELLAYLEVSGHHNLRKWRDETLAYIAYILAASRGVKVSYEKYLPPSLPKKVKEQTPEELEAMLRVSMSFSKKGERK